MTYVLFASNVFMELHYEEGCMTEDCFSVWTFYNGILLEFDDFCAINNKCTYPEFVAMMDAIAYKGLNADDLDKACDQTAKCPFSDCYPEVCDWNSAPYVCLEWNGGP